MPERHTWIVQSPVMRRALLLDAARARRHGCQILGMAPLAARLAGGRVVPLSRSALPGLIRHYLNLQDSALGDLESLRRFPGFPRSLAHTLYKLWLAKLSLRDLASTTSNPDTARRCHALQVIEDHLLRSLPRATLAPPALAAAALARVQAAPVLLGPVTIKGVPDVDPVWRHLLIALARVVPVVWELGHERIPDWLDGSGINLLKIERRDTPALSAVSCADPQHEALEALRWARELVVSGAAMPQDIALCAPVPGVWDEYFAVQSRESGLPLAFVHGRPALATREGQTAAALGEVLNRGLSQSRVRRLLSLLVGHGPAITALPRDWHRLADAEWPLERLTDWQRAFLQPQNGEPAPSWAPDLLALVARLAAGPAAAQTLGETLLNGNARRLWERALGETGVGAVDLALARLRLPEHAEFGAAVLWGTAEAIAACPRPFVRLLGLTNARWPRAQREDPLLPAHLIDPALLDPVPLAERDARDFHTLTRRAGRAVVLSFSRRAEDGQEAGRSPLLDGYPITPLARARVPAHAATPADRLLARPTEFRASALGLSARNCWVNWQKEILTEHDGLLSAGHPLIAQVLARPVSPSALVLLLRNLPVYVWKYALNWQAPRDLEGALEVASNDLGSLTHLMLEHALTLGGALPVTTETADALLDRAQAAAEADWLAQRPLPTPELWRLACQEARRMAQVSLLLVEGALTEARSRASWPELRFGAPDKATPADAPWDTTARVLIPGLEVAITGSIDRLDLLQLPDGGQRAVITDFKTGRLPDKAGTQMLKGGAEVQRLVYSFAVQALLRLAPEAIEPALLYPRALQRLLFPASPDAASEVLKDAIQHARELLRAGAAVPGAGTWDPPRGDEFRCALPAGHARGYRGRKEAAATARLQPLEALWQHP